MRLVCVRRRNRFQQRLRLLALKGRRIVTQAYLRYALTEKSLGCLKGHKSGLRTLFKTAPQVTFGANIYVFLGKRSFHFFPAILLVVSTRTRGRFQRRSKQLFYFDFTALSDEQPQETPHWPKLITNSLKGTRSLQLKIITRLACCYHSGIRSSRKTQKHMGKKSNDGRRRANILGCYRRRY